MQNLMPEIILIVGCFLLFFLLKSKWPGWMGLPFAFLVVNAIRDLGITPLLNKYIEYSWVSPTAGVASPGEVPASVMLILLNAMAIGGGMVIALVFSHFSRRTRLPICQVSYSPYVVSKAWKASVAMFGFGLLCQAFVIYMLLQEFSLSDFGRTRALFSAEVALRTPIYYYVRTFSNTMVIGAWGMFLFSGNSLKQKRLSIGAIVSIVCLEILFGGRTKTMMILLAIGILYHYGKRKIRPKNILKIALITVVCLLPIQFLRFDFSSIGEGLGDIAKYILMSPTIDETAFALRYFPNNIPFMGSGVMVGSLTHLFPTLGKHLPWANNLWSLLVDNFYYGCTPSAGIGGEHFAPPAEHYMQFGLNGVIVIGMVLGLLYGFIFSWQKRNQKNLFLLMFATYAYLGFVVSVTEGKMVAYIGGMGLSALLPIGILAAMACVSREKRLALFIPLGLCPISFVLKRFIGWELFDYTFAMALGYAYVISIKIIAKANPEKKPTNNSVPAKAFKHGTFYQVFKNENANKTS